MAKKLRFWKVVQWMPAIMNGLASASKRITQIEEMDRILAKAEREGTSATLTIMSAEVPTVRRDFQPLLKLARKVARFLG